jgi:SAM-dependent methyltransferase
MMLVNAQYNIVKPKSLSNKIGGHQRRKMFERFVDCMKVGALDTILDIGVTTDRSFDDSNYLEAWYPYKSRITAVGIDNAEFLESLFPGVRFVQADGRDLPFESGAFDFVHSSAVLEHVGSRQQQTQFLREAWRVARKGVFITTPNRRFPVEFHTVLPLIHWLPLPLYRKLLVALGYEFFADESNLNLLSVRSLTRAVRAAGIERFDIGSVSLLGLPTNLTLIARKRIWRARVAFGADEAIVV